MPLSQDELVRRIVAARELRGVKQLDLGRQVAAEGLGLHDIPKIERGDKTAPPFSGAHRRVLASILAVPEEWFTARDDELFAINRSLGEQVDLLAGTVTELRQEVAALGDQLKGTAELAEDVSNRVSALEPQPGETAADTPAPSHLRRQQDG